MGDADIQRCDIHGSYMVGGLLEACQWSLLSQSFVFKSLLNDSLLAAFCFIVPDKASCCLRNRMYL